MLQAKRRGNEPTLAPTRRALHTTSKLSPPWRNPSLVAASEAASAWSEIQSEDAKILLVLISFFSTVDKIPINLLFRGAAPCKRWTAQGGIEEVDAIHVGLAPELLDFLSDITRLERSFHSLIPSSAVSKDHEQIYTLGKAAANHVRERLSAEDLLFWKYQALIITYRAIPWKYIEPV